MAEWVEYKEIDFASDYAWVNIDTRDFHAIKCADLNMNLEMPPNFTKNKEWYFHTPEEVKALIERYYTESGGAGEWRRFSLYGAKEVSGWDMKYIAVVKHKYGLLVCKRPYKENLVPIKKATLSLPVEKRYLNHY